VVVDVPAGVGQHDRTEFAGHASSDLPRGEDGDQVRREVAVGIGEHAEREARQAGQHRLDDALVGLQMRPDGIELAQLGHEDGPFQLGHPEVHAQERATADLDAESERAVPLVVHGEAAPIEILVVGDDHPAVATGDRLELVEAEDPDLADAAHAAATVAGPEGLGAVLDQGDAMAVGNGPQLGQPRRVAQHVDRHDRPRPRRDARLHVDRVEVERLVDLGQDGQGPGIHDGGDRRDEGEARHDDLVAGADPEPGQRQPDAARPGIHGERVGHAGQPGDLLLEMPYAGAEGRVVVRAVATQEAAPEHPDDLGDLFLADQLEPRTGQAGLLCGAPAFIATDCTGR